MSNIQFELPKHHKSIIKVVGVGGGGSNAVNHMYNQGIKDVEFIVCNTDAQALKTSPVPSRMQLGMHLTEGLGAGANPEIGQKAALESKEDIRELLQDNTKMVFITAGMGGGTGTGAAPVIAQIARELDILTVGIVTVPFVFEGKKKMNAALEGVERLKQYCDTVLVILNDKLREVHGNLTISTAFAQADNVLTNAAKSIAEIITESGYVNVDFQDVRTVMRDAGGAVMGAGEAEGENRARRAAEMALASPLLNNRDINGAQKILLSIVSGEEEELQMDELSSITEHIQEEAGDDAEVIFGHAVDPELGAKIRVTVIATGFENQLPEPKRPGSSPADDETKKVFDLESNKQIDLFEEPAAKPAHKQVEWNVSRDRSAGQAPTPGFQFEGTSRPAPQEEEPQPERDSYYDESVEEEFEIVEGPRNTVRDAEDEELAAERREYELGRTPFIPGMSEVDLKKQQLLDAARRRVRKLREAKEPRATDEEIKEKLNQPAYLRKKVKLKDPPHSSENNISKFQLNDENQITGQNRWLHDNVD